MNQTIAKMQKAVSRPGHTADGSRCGFIARHKLFMLPLCAILCAGCTDSSTAKRGEVSGTVTLDGKPIEKGEIIFLPTNGTAGPTAGAEIKDGSYFVNRKVGPPAGDNIVQFQSTRATGRKVPDRTGQRLVDEFEDLIPVVLGRESTLIRKIQPGSNTINFELSTTPPYSQQ